MYAFVSYFVVQQLIHHFYFYFFCACVSNFNGKMNECMHVASSIMQIRTLGNIVTQHAATVYSCNEELLNFNKSKCSDRRCFITILIVKKKKKEHVACRVLIRAMLKMCSLSQFDGCCPCARIRKKTSGSTGPCCTFTKTPLPEEVDENTGIYMADKHLFYVQNVHCTRKRAVSSHCAANERFNFI